MQLLRCFLYLADISDVILIPVKHTKKDKVTSVISNRKNLFILYCIIFILGCGTSSDGGDSDENADADNTATQVSSTASDDWSLLSATNSPSGRIFHSAIWSGSEMIVWGGASLDDPNGPANTGSRYNPSTKAWTATSTENAPSKRFGHCSVWTTSGMFVFGGETDSSTLLNDGFLYATATNTWTQVSSTNAPDARIWPMCIWTGEKVLVWGGLSTDTTTALATGAVYNPADDTWTAMSTTNAIGVVAGPFGIGYYATDKAFFWNLANTTGGFYDAANDSWTTALTDSAPSGRFGAAHTYDSNKVYIFGGQILSTGAATNEGYVFDTANNFWTTITTENAPDARFGATMSMISSKLRVWGGWSNGTTDAIKQGGVYTVTGGSWAPMETASAPPSRALHSVVNTGTAMIVWGGGSHFQLPGVVTEAATTMLANLRSAISLARSQNTSLTQVYRDKQKSLLLKKSPFCRALSLAETLVDTIVGLTSGTTGGYYLPVTKTTTSSETTTTDTTTSAPTTIQARLEFDPDPTPEPTPAQTETPKEDSDDCFNPFE